MNLFIFLEKVYSLYSCIFLYNKCFTKRRLSKIFKQEAITFLKQYDCPFLDEIIFICSVALETLEGVHQREYNILFRLLTRRS